METQISCMYLPVSNAYRVQHCAAQLGLCPSLKDRCGLVPLWKNSVEALFSMKLLCIYERGTVYNPDVVK